MCKLNSSVRVLAAMTHGVPSDWWGVGWGVGVLTDFEIKVNRNHTETSCSSFDCYLFKIQYFSNPHQVLVVLLLLLLLMLGFFVCSGSGMSNAAWMRTDSEQ